MANTQIEKWENEREELSSSICWFTFQVSQMLTVPEAGQSWKLGAQGSHVVQETRVLEPLRCPPESTSAQGLSQEQSSTQLSAKIC